MSNNELSHQTTTGYNALPFVASAAITTAFNSGGFAAIKNKAVKITADKTVDLVAAGDKVFGSIISYDLTDGTSAKVGVQHAGQIPFKNSAGAAALVPNGRGVKGGAVAGDIALATTTDLDFGVLTSAEGNQTYIVVPR